jgi:hypothetical protein
MTTDCSVGTPDITSPLSLGINSKIGEMGTLPLMFHGFARQPSFSRIDGMSEFNKVAVSGECSGQPARKVLHQIGWELLVNMSSCGVAINKYRKELNCSTTYISPVCNEFNGSAIRYLNIW